MFDIGAGEIMALIVLAVIMFGPDKIPGFARKAARVVRYLRGVANQATDQLKSELGPEYADLTLNDLNPKTFLQKHLLNDVQDDLDDIKAELTGVKQDLASTASGIEDLASSAAADLTADSPAGHPAEFAVPGVRFDLEAT